MIRLIIFVLMLVHSGFGLTKNKEGKLEISRIADNVYLHTSYGMVEGYGLYPSNGLVVIEGKQAYIIDTPWPEKDTKTLLEWIKKSGFTPRASLSTHFHKDRTSGIALLNQNKIKTYASALTNQLLKSNNREKAKFDFDSESYPLLKGVIEAYYPGAGHSQDNIVVWLPKAKILFGGCLVRSLASKGMGNTEDGSLKDWASSIEKVQEKFSSIERVVPGHGKIGGLELMSHTIQLVKRENSKPFKTKEKTPLH